MEIDAGIGDVDFPDRSNSGHSCPIIDAPRTTEGYENEFVESRVKLTVLFVSQDGWVATLVEHPPNTPVALCLCMMEMMLRRYWMLPSIRESRSLCTSY